MRKLLSLSIGLLLLLLISLPALAEDLQVRAELNSTQAQVGENLTLTLTVEGEVSVTAPEVEIPGCQVRYYGPSTQIQMINGRQYMKVSHLYQVVPMQAGTLEVPAIELKVQGMSYWTEPLTLIVSDRGQGVIGSAGGELDEYLFLEVIPARRKMYVNEEIPLTVNLYVLRDLDLRNIHFPEVPLSEFVVQQFPQPNQGTQYLNNKYFTVFTFRTTIRPITAGTFKLSGVSLQTDVLVPRQGRGFFTDYQTYSANLVAPEIELQVLNFPAEGKPAGFNGAVGKYKMEVTVNPQEVKVGEPVTIRTRITGTGSISTVTAPVIAKDSRFKYYDAQSVEPANGANAAQAEKVFEQVIIPMGEVEGVPAISFSYFDPETGRYQTLREEAFPLQVSGGSIASVQLEDYRTQEKSAEVLGQGILYIKANPGRFTTVARAGLVTPGLLSYNLALLLALGGGFFWKRKMSLETPEERRLKAVRTATQRQLEECAGLLQAGKAADFCNTLYQTVQNYLKERYQITITGISAYEMDYLQKAGLPVELLEQIRTFFRDMDASRFAGGFASGQDMHPMLERARQLIAAVEKGEVAE